MSKNLKPECAEKTKQKRIVLAEKRTKSKITFLNSYQIEIEKIIVDGCQITENDLLKCDFMLNIEEAEYFIELKGQDFNHAVKQIESTINLLSQGPENQPKKCFVISSRSPKSSPKIQQIQTRFKKKFKADFIFKNSGFEYKI